MHSAGDDEHPGNGLVEGQVLVQQSLDLTRRTLCVDGVEGSKGQGVCVRLMKLPATFNGSIITH